MKGMSFGLRGTECLLPPLSEDGSNCNAERLRRRMGQSRSLKANEHRNIGDKGVSFSGLSW